MSMYLTLDEFERLNEDIYKELVDISTYSKDNADFLKEFKNR